MQIQAINPKYQRALEALYRADREHVALVDRHAEALSQLDPDSDRYQRMEERQLDKESAAYDARVERFIERPELPKRELDAFARAYAQHHGYTPYLTA
jgi:hypothetical protein